jgi:hypothetical protein
VWKSPVSKCTFPRSRHKAVSREVFRKSWLADADARRSFAAVEWHDSDRLLERTACLPCLETLQRLIAIFRHFFVIFFQALQDIPTARVYIRAQLFDIACACRPEVLHVFFNACRHVVYLSLTDRRELAFVVLKALSARATRLCALAQFLQFHDAGR